MNIVILLEHSLLKQIKIDEKKHYHIKEYEKELFLIPKFVVVGFPMQNSQKNSYYYIELQILKAYCYDFKNTKEQYQGLLNDVTFQYDINKQANG